MTGVDSSIMVHRLCVVPNRKSVWQKRRACALDRSQAIAKEANKLLEVGFIREVTYPDLLANVVLWPTSNGKWRMCVDFIDLNKACPKGNFPFPRIDMLVDSTAEHELLSFWDGFSGYNQIQMDLIDQEKTSFILDRGLHCYLVIPFCLKNGATYKSLVNLMFKVQIGRNMEFYVDDMLVKSRRARSHLSNLREAFDTLD